MKKHVRKTVFVALTIISSAILYGQNVNRQVLPSMEAINQRQMIMVPEVNGYYPIKCDFHLHTIFSDGTVLPQTRVDEAWNDGLDAIAFTDHDLDHPYTHYQQDGGKSLSEIATKALSEKGIIVIQGLEVTKKMPPGHFNALFVTDPAIPELDDTSRSAFITAIEKLTRQGAVIIWNHPGWVAQQKDTVKWFDVHQTMLDKGLLHGIEIFNYNEWYPIALDWCISKHLSPFANSDSHGPIKQTYHYTGEFIRPMTLVFAKEKNEAGIREAILGGRTVAWFDGMLAGHEQWLSALLKNSIKVEKQVTVKGKTKYMLINLSDFTVIIKGATSAWDQTMELMPRSTTSFTAPEKVTAIEVNVTNWWTGMNQTLRYRLELNPDPVAR